MSNILAAIKKVLVRAIVLFLVASAIVLAIVGICHIFPSPWIGTTIITFLCIAAIIYILWIDDKFKRMFPKLNSDYVIISLMVLFAVSFFVAGCIQTNRDDKAEQAEIQNAIVGGAPSASISGFCIGNKFYIKNASGKFVYLSEDRQVPLKCGEKTTERSKR